MVGLYFGGAVSAITTIIVLGMLAVIIAAAVKRGKIETWGRLILLFIIAGTAVSALSATRDGFATGTALFAMGSVQSVICAAAGAAIYITGIVSAFLKKQPARRACFFVISVLFIVQVLTVEISRIALL